MTILRRAITDPYRAIMDPAVNPLTNLPASQRFQIMMYLGMMWTVIFCAGTGAWLWFGQLVVLHLLVALGPLVTGLTFRSANDERSRVLADIRAANCRGRIPPPSGPDPNPIVLGSSVQGLELARVTVWFDGGCPLCLREIALMQRLDRRGAIAFIDVARGEASCPIDRRELLARFHAEENGLLLSGAHGVHIRRELTGEAIEEHAHRARIRPRQNQRKRLVRAGLGGGKQVQALVAPVDNAWRAHPALVPDPCRAPLLPDPRLVLTPNLEAVVGMLSCKGLQLRGQILF